MKLDAVPYNLFQLTGGTGENVLEYIHAKRYPQGLTGETNMTNQTIPSFKSYAVPGDFIEWESEGYTIRATLHNDTDTHVQDFECYSQEEIQAWENDGWFYVGVVLSVSYNGIKLEDHAASLWGIDCNFPGGTNAYLSECALEMQDEAIGQAKIKHKQMIKALTK